MRVGALYAVLRLETAQFDAALGKAQSKMGAFMGVLRAAALLGVQSMAALAAGSLFVAQDFEKHMQESLAIMGDVSDGMRKKMEDAARAIAKTSTFSANEAADAYYFLASAGFTAEQSIAALPAVTQFAQAGVMDLEKATSYLLDTTTTMGLRTEDAAQNMHNMTRVSDVLTMAAVESNASLEEMAVALMNKAGPALRVLGKDVEEGAAVLMVMANAGVKGKVAGTNLGIILRELQTKAIKNKDAFAEAGVAVFDASGEMRNMGDIVADLEDHLEGLTDEQKKQALLDLGFTDRSVGVIQSLLGTSDAIKKYERELREAGGTTKTVAEKQLDTFNAQLQIAWHKVVDLGISIGQKLLPGAKDMVVAFGNWIDENHDLIVSLATGLFDAVGKVVGAFADFLGLVGDIVSALSPFIDTIGDVIDNFRHLEDFVREDSPIGAIATALLPVIRIFEGIIENVGYMVGELDNLEDHVGEDSPLGMLAGAGEKVGEIFDWLAVNVWPRLTDAAIFFSTEILPRVVDAFNFIVEEVIPRLIEAFTFLIEEIVPRISEAFAWVADNIFPAVAAAIQYIAEEILPWFLEQFSGILTWVEENMPTIQAIIGEALDAIAVAFGLAWDIISFIWTAFGQQIVAGAQMFAEFAMPIIGGALSFLLETFRVIFDQIGKIWQQVVDSAVVVGKAIGDAFEWLAEFFSGLWDGIGGVFRDGLNVIIDMINGFIGFLNGLRVDIPRIGIPGTDIGVGGVTIDPFDFGTIPRLAMGTLSFPGGLAMVGEEGPELAYLPRGARVYPHGQTERMLDGMGDGEAGLVVNATVQQHNVASFGTPAEIRRAAQMLAPAIVEALRQRGLVVSRG